MKELYELKEKLVDTLKDYGRKDLSASTLDMIDKLAHAAKNVCKIIEDSDDGNSGYYPHRDGSYHMRDSRGRYSGDYSRGSLKDKLHELMEDAPDDHTRTEIKRLADRL